MWYVYANVLSYRHTKHIIMNTIFGYWRCSTDAQDQERQIRALKDAGCEVIVGDHITGVSDYGDRRELSKLLDQLEAGSLLILDELSNFPGAPLLRDLIALTPAMCPRPPLFTPGLDTFIKSLDL